jgi:hypothetical protein
MSRNVGESEDNGVYRLAVAGVPSKNAAAHPQPRMVYGCASLNRGASGGQFPDQSLAIPGQLLQILDFTTFDCKRRAAVRVAFYMPE